MKNINKLVTGKKYILKLRDGVIKNKWLLIAFFAILSMLPLLFISIYSRPSADDYGYSKHVVGMINSGNYNIFSLILEAIKVDIFMWKTSDGPFLSQIIMTLQPGIWGEHYYGIGAIVLVLLSGLLLFFTFKNLCKLFGVSSKYSICYALLVLSLFLNNVPAINEGIYWFDGAWNYTPFIFLILLNVSLVLNQMKLDSKGFVGVCLLAFISSGGNFIVTYANVLITFTLAVYALIIKKRKFVMPFVFALVGFLIEFFAPGTNVRVGDSFSTQSIIGTILMSVKGAYAYLSIWMKIEWIFMMIMICIVIILLKSGGELRISEIKCRINPVWFYVYTIGFMVALLCLPYYATGGTPSPRILNVVWFMFMIMSGVSVAYTFVWCMVKKADATGAGIVKPGSEFVMAVLMIVCVFGICFHNDSNSITALRELGDGTAKTYASECDERYERMSNASLGDELETAPLTYSKIIYFADLSENSDDWQNKSWKEYYGVGMHVVR